MTVRGLPAGYYTPKQRASLRNLRKQYVQAFIRGDMERVSYCEQQFNGILSTVVKRQQKRVYVTSETIKLVAEVVHCELLKAGISTEGRSDRVKFYSVIVLGWLYPKEVKVRIYELMGVATETGSAWVARSKGGPKCPAWYHDTLAKKLLALLADRLQIGVDTSKTAA